MYRKFAERVILLFVNARYDIMEEADLSTADWIVAVMNWGLDHCRDFGGLIMRYW